METEILRYFVTAEGVLQNARGLIQGGATRKPTALPPAPLELPQHTGHAGAERPLLVKSTPPRGPVALNGEPVGPTPLTLYYDPLAKFTLAHPEAWLPSPSPWERKAGRSRSTSPRTGRCALRAGAHPGLESSTPRRR